MSSEGQQCKARRIGLVNVDGHIQVALGQLNPYGAWPQKQLPTEEEIAAKLAEEDEQHHDAQEDTFFPSDAKEVLLLGSAALLPDVSAIEGTAEGDDEDAHDAEGSSLAVVTFLPLEQHTSAQGQKEGGVAHDEEQENEPYITPIEQLRRQQKLRRLTASGVDPSNSFLIRGPTATAGSSGQQQQKEQESDFTSSYARFLNQRAAETSRQAHIAEVKRRGHVPLTRAGGYVEGLSKNNGYETNDDLITRSILQDSAAAAALLAAQEDGDGDEELRAQRNLTSTIMMLRAEHKDRGDWRNNTTNNTITRKSEEDALTFAQRQQRRGVSGAQRDLLVDLELDFTEEDISHLTPQKQHELRVEKQRHRCEQWLEKLYASLALQRFTGIMDKRLQVETLEFILTPFVRRRVASWTKQAQQKTLTRSRCQNVPRPTPALLRKTCELFRDWSDQGLAKLCSGAVPVAFNAGSYVYHSGDYTRPMFYVAVGAVDLVVVNGRNAERPKSKAKDNGIVVETVNIGGVFGEASLLTGEPRTYSALCAQDTCLWEVPLRLFTICACDLSPLVIKDIERQCDERLKRHMQSVFPMTSERLQACPVFAGWHAAALQELAAAFVPVLFRRGSVMYHTNENDNRAVFLLSGAVTISKKLRDDEGNEMEDLDPMLLEYRKGQEQLAALCASSAPTMSLQTVKLRKQQPSTRTALPRNSSSAAPTQQQQRQQFLPTTSAADADTASDEMLSTTMTSEGGLLNNDDDDIMSASGSPIGGTAASSPTLAENRAWNASLSSAPSPSCRSTSPKTLYSTLKEAIEARHSDDRELTSGAFFGFEELLFGGQRVDNAVCSTACATWVLSREKYVPLAMHFARCAVESRNVVNRIRALCLEKPKVAHPALRHNHTLRFLIPETVLQNNWEKAEAFIAPPAEIIFRPEDACQYIYCIVSGTIHVRHFPIPETLRVSTTINTTSMGTTTAAESAALAHEAQQQSSAPSAISQSRGFHVVIPETQYHGMAFGGVEMALRHSRYLSSVRCTSACIVYKIPIQPMLEEISRGFPPVKNAMESLSTFNAVLQHFEDETLRDLKKEQNPPCDAANVKVGRKLAHLSAYSSVLGMGAVMKKKKKKEQQRQQQGGGQDRASATPPEGALHHDITTTTTAPAAAESGGMHFETLSDGWNR